LDRYIACRGVNSPTDCCKLPINQVDLLIRKAIPADGTEDSLVPLLGETLEIFRLLAIFPPNIWVNP
jgi:hypothetical protein